MDKLKRQKQLKVMLPLLIVISVFVWVPNFTNDSKKEAPSNAIQNQSTSLEQLDIVALISSSHSEIDRKQSSFQQWGRNPFITKDWAPIKSVIIPEQESTPIDVVKKQEVVPLDPIVLNGIFWNNHKPSALINDEVVGIGSAYKMYEVINITMDTVTLNYGTKDFEFKLNQQQ